LLAVLFLVAFRLNGSSIGVNWDNLYGDVEADPTLIIGKPRPIRSDEYVGDTPWTIMEAQTPFTQVIPSIGSYKISSRWMFPSDFGA